MPTYDDSCAACGHRFERFESINDDAIKKCPKCSKKKAKRQIGTGAGLIFKGSGFYTTDYKKTSGGDSGGEKAKDSGGEKPKEPEKKPDVKEKKKGEKESK